MKMVREYAEAPALVFFYYYKVEVPLQSLFPSMEWNVAVLEFPTIAD
jgi:hypothetical protein